MHSQEYWDRYNEAEYKRLLKEELKRPKECHEICGFAQHCHRPDLWSTDNSPEKCKEYTALEDYSWDAECAETPFCEEYDGPVEEEEP